MGYRDDLRNVEDVLDEAEPTKPRRMRKSEQMIDPLILVSAAVLAAAESISAVRCYRSVKGARRECIGQNRVCACREEARRVLAEHGMVSPETEAGIPGFVL